MHTGHGSHLFQVNSTTATIITRLNNSLDRETNETYHLTLRATDGGNKTSTVPLVVKVTDVNDELPRFSQQVFYANVSEDAARGTIVTRLTATDLDLLILNKEITYTSTGADAKFYINRATGLSVSQCLLRAFTLHYFISYQFFFRVLRQNYGTIFLLKLGVPILFYLLNRSFRHFYLESFLLILYFYVYIYLFIVYSKLV